MPITVDGKTFQKFADAVRHVMQKRKISKERASAIVAAIEKKQVGASQSYEILDPDQAKDMGLDPSKLYAQFFLYNNDMNNAGDPINYKIYPDHNQQIAKSFIGRPYLLPEKTKDGKWKTKHHRANDLNVLLENQKKFALGEIVQTPYNELTGNYNAIVDVFPEHRKRVEDGDIPPFTSPMFQPQDFYIDDKGKMHIKQAIGVHLQGVPTPGYDPALSSIKSVCKGGLDECMSELKMVAASGQLSATIQKESFSKDPKSAQSSIMSQEQPQQTLSPEQIVQKIMEHDKMLQDIAAQLKDISSKLGGQDKPQAGQQPPGQQPVGAAAEGGADPTIQAGSQQQMAPQTQQPSKLDEITNELNKLKEDQKAEKEKIEKERLEIAIQKRQAMANEIVEAQIKLNRLPLEKKEEEVKRLVELKTDDGEYVDLSLLHSELKAQLSKFVGAAGDVQIYSVPDLESGDSDDKKNYTETMENIGFI